MPKVPPAYLEARRQSIVEAARRAFVRKGTQLTTMADIAAEVGITPGAIYRYFPTKEDLVECCLGASSDDVGQRWDQPVQADRDPLDELAELSRLTFGALNRAEEHEDALILFEHIISIARDGDETSLAEHREMSRTIAAKVAARLAAAQDRGELGPEIDARLLAEALLSFYWGARITRLLNAGADTDGQLEQLFHVLDGARIAHRAGQKTRPLAEPVTPG